MKSTTFYKYFTLLIALVLIPAVLMAKTPKDNTKHIIYLFGYSTCLSDTVVYITEVQSLDGVELTKEKFLKDRQEYSAQLKTYLEPVCGVAHQTAAVFYGQNKKKVEKKYLKLRKNLLDKHKAFQEVKATSFQFQVIKQ